MAWAKKIIQLSVCPINGMLVTITHNTYIAATKNKTMKATALGIWYMQIPSGIVVDCWGNIVEPKEHNGSKFVLRDRKRFAISKLPKLDYTAAMEFKKVFVD